MKTELEYLVQKERYDILSNLLILCIFRCPTLIAFMAINDDNYGENAFLNLVNGFVMEIGITQLLITLFEKFFRQNDPYNALYLPKSNIKHLK